VSATGTQPRRGVRVVLAGIGNEMRHDDGAGPVVASRAAQMAGPQLRDALVVPVTAPLDLLGHWDDSDLAIVVDAVRSGAQPGTVTLTWLDEPGGVLQVAHGGPSTHGLGVADVYLLAHELGQAPRRVAVVGVEGLDFSFGQGLSAPVDAGVARAAGLVVDLARQVLDEGPGRA